MEKITNNCQWVTGPGVPLSPEATDQLERIAGQRGCVQAVGMPDLHVGPGIPIGACFAFDRVRPALVGGDIGCGARVTVVRSKFMGDALERRVRDALSAPLASDAALQEASVAAWYGGVRGLADALGLPEALREVAAREGLDDLRPSPEPPGALSGLGTIGGGNHFAELSRVGVITDRPYACALAVDKSKTAVVVHSGSRGVGASIGERWGDCELLPDEAGEYLAELAGAIRFAAANRFVITWRLLTAVGAARASRIDHGFDVVHNSVLRCRLSGAANAALGELYLHRKGCAPAHLGEPAIVLGSRGTPSWLMRGLGQVSTLFSVAHGAGRRLSRMEARARFKTKSARKNLLRTPLGGRVICGDTKLLFEEHPDAYKPIEPVVDAIEAANMAVRVASLLPMITVKQ